MLAQSGEIHFEGRVISSVEFEGIVLFVFILLCLGLLFACLFCFLFLFLISFGIKIGPSGKTVQQEEANLDWGSGDIVNT